MTSIKTSENYNLLLLELINGKEADGRQIDYSIKKRTEIDKTDKAYRMILSFIGNLFLTGKITSKEAAQDLYKICLELEIDEADREKFYLFDNNLYLAYTGIVGKIEQIETDLKLALEPYKKLQFHNYEDWKMINLEIDEQLK